MKGCEQLPQKMVSVRRVWREVSMDLNDADLRGFNSAGREALCSSDFWFE